ncbi:aldehyde dehydrogenase family protein [Mycobacterium sp. LTG2003]
MSVSANPAARSRFRSSAVQEWLDAHEPRLLIDNSWVPARTGRTFETVNPTDETVLGYAAEAEAADVDDAVKAARAAFDDGPWSRMGPSERAQLLRRFADLIEADADRLAELETLDNGMTIATARALLKLGIESLHFFAGSANLVSGHTMPSHPTSFNYVLREPVGVVGAIIPWNGPIISALWKIGPALAAGNTLVLKPAEQTPLTASRLGELALEAGLPAGVLNILTGFGPGAGSSIARHHGIDKVAFTGSVETGRLVLRASEGNLKRVLLELGGKSPNVIFPDADLEQALPAALAGFCMLSGQACAAGTRVLVQRDFKDEFVDKLSAYAAAVIVGDPLDPETTVGPLASKEQFDRVRGYLEVGRSEGATPKFGGTVRSGRGYFVDPTVFDDVDSSMRIAREEIFGPVVAVIPFTDEHDAVVRANDTTYGLAAAVWTNDVTRAHTMARRLRAGTVWINTFLALNPNMPFGGYKQSGIGRELGPNWFHEYTEEKSVILKL